MDDPESSNDNDSPVNSDNNSVESVNYLAKLLVMFIGKSRNLIISKFS
ncbi:hypothetical protein [Acetivibrio cellulolyticus]|nr:hypothetical protein [Acetivibrio cellulolyticus]